MDPHEWREYSYLKGCDQIKTSEQLMLRAQEIGVTMIFFADTSVYFFSSALFSLVLFPKWSQVKHKK